ncbi:GspE/PulE family protein [Rodentibacter caecimuris]|uniref:Protein transporter HofB n=1 Tax=Rodentibacter caecimuris TaxID=1796644 RepID=A0ABX3L2H5_9PAST|nr:protein transporter HofB [Rodentibacter heylii]
MKSTPNSNGNEIITNSGERFTISPQRWEQNKQQSELLLRYFTIPLQENEHTLWLAVDSFNNLAACESFSFLTGKFIEPVLVSTKDLKALLQQLSPQKMEIEENQPAFYTQGEPEIEIQSDEPVIQLLNNIFESALQRQASDIHLEPQADGLHVRFRIDGVLQIQPTITKGFENRLISRLKLLAKLDISETRLPQDGRFQFKTQFSDILDFRLSTLPTYLGEKAVLRLQQNKPVTLSFSELGMTDSQVHRFEATLKQPQGLILVTGPTGSGKSITLYTALQFLNSPDKHIMTAEDPIEIELSGIIQSQINPHIGLDFSCLLRTFLRQDPDIIMLGEIRDEESAMMALKAAQTGHLVLSTLHTNDASSAIARLQQLGIKSNEIENSLLLVIAQRLVRKCCQKCGQNSNTSCDCNQSYQGRIGIYQFLYPSNQEYYLDFNNLHQSALVKIEQGITDLAEVNRVLGNEI